MPVNPAKVIFQPEVSQGMLYGFEQIVQTIRPTLGPCPRLVALDRSDLNKPPELMDNGGLIARRIVEIPDRRADVGAMFLRHALWRVHQQVGDGTATCAVIFEAVYRYCRRYLVAGGNPMQVRRYLDEGVRLILAQLDGMTRPVESRTHLARVAQSLCYDPDLADAMSEIFDILGLDGNFEALSGRGRELEREYVIGSHWKSELLSQAFTSDSPQFRAEVHDAYVLITDLELKEPRQLLPVFASMKDVEHRSLLIISRQISEPVAAVLAAARRDGGYQIVAAKTPGSMVTDQAIALEDLSLLTGGRPFVAASGESLESMRLEHLGRVRRAWVDRNHLGIAGGKGDPIKRRDRLQQLRKALAVADEDDTRSRLESRIGRLLGGSAYLWVGAATEAELEVRKALAERAARSLRSALREGVVPGGGTALLACLPALTPVARTAQDSDKRVAFGALHSALQVPFRTIVENAGYEPGSLMPDKGRLDDGIVFDVLSGDFVDAHQAGIWDAAAVLRVAVQTAVASAALALTTDVIVQHKKPKTAAEP
jgi:chaperonin GroEL